MSVCMDGMTLLADEEYTMMVHALGLTRKGGRGRFGRRWAYRNYYAASQGDAEVWRKLMKRGLAKSACEPKPLRPFHTFAVTQKGMAAADVLAYVPKEILEAAQ